MFPLACYRKKYQQRDRKKKQNKFIGTKQHGSAARPVG
jgi:hypothetical protein